MATQVQPKPSAWDALASHYKTGSKLDLRQLFADVNHDIRPIA